MIKKWLKFKTYREMQIFLRFVNFYKRFIYYYFKIIALLMSLLKNNENEKKKFFRVIEVSRANVSSILRHFYVDFFSYSL